MLLHRHRELCERAVDPLEIAAGLEAHGVTDRTAARFRHRDVFSLAEELYARVPRGGEGDETAGRPRGTGEGAAVTGRSVGTGRPAASHRARWLLAAALPGAVCGLVVLGDAHTSGPLRLALLAVGAVALAGALALSLRRGPLGAPGRTPVGARVWGALLLAYAVFGDGLLDGLIRGGPETLCPPATAPLLGLALAVVPAVACARLFAVRARRRLTGSRGLDDFTARARPLLVAVIALYLAALTGLLVIAGLVPGTRPGALAPAVALGALLFLARLLVVHGFPGPAATALGAACAAEALAAASVLAGRLPGCDLLAAPVRAAVETWGTAAVPALACGATAPALLVHAVAVLSRASAHARP
ncbi:hypothetical protein GCM10023237_21310 [Streptomyces coeruleoprunus]